ncbi:putative autotransporter adhesin-like protein [Chitinophaga dinghuensis]|uniref:Putative autotransporter adhesin-like protein n=1 Tax=Chitinophaga dinghuensis TaxID=1539050 RepID=A0A327WF66_9BACT|nr:head GIN domain-containing protein [Chitinophaga dinghuensis]RAJ88201.1 putative autotransporter adhesin-like protein [Chitinophaga dinghuensis]
MKKLTAISLAFIAAIVLLSSFKTWNERVKGSGVVKTEDRSAGKFTGIATSGIFKVELTQGNSESIKLEAEDNILPIIETRNTNGTLEIFIKKGYNIQTNKDIKVFITMAELKRLSLSGACKVTSTNSFKGDKLNIDQSGASVVKLDVAMSNLMLALSGAAVVDLSGKANSMNIGASGGSHIRTTGLSTETVKIGSSGGSEIEVNAVKSLTVSSSGGSQVKYKGTPEVQQSLSGGASVSKY